jgi:hypothetical protein
MSEVLETIQVKRAFGEVVEGEAVVSEEGFSPATTWTAGAG